MKRILLAMVCPILLLTNGCSANSAENEPYIFQASELASETLLKQYFQNMDSNPKEASLWLMHAAHKGNAEAEYYLAEHYRDGSLTLRKDIKVSLQWLRRASARGYVPAKATLASFYDKGSNEIKQDHIEACRLYSQIAALKPKSLPNEGGSTDERIERMQIQLANSDIYQAANKVAKCYYFGEASSQNNKKAYEWFSKAADGEEVEAQYYLGMMNIQGIGVRQNYPDAHFWLEKAANENYNDAQLQLGILYFKGAGCRQDYVEAYKWINLAAAKGTESALQARKDISKFLTATQVAEGQKLSREWEKQYAASY